MFLYNVTVNIDENIENEWIEWMRNVHIPDVMATGCFTSARMSQLLGEVAEASGPTYAIQYVYPDEATLERYQKEFAPKLQAAHTKRYENQFVAFRTLMKITEEWAI
ncbi:MAG: DUF4286 family protein [Bernardetiaceae bacterium]|nr:DUF4286 family protein [Bernardetiaceae bacterium]